MVGMAKAIGHEVNNPLTSLMLQVGKIHHTFLQEARDLLDQSAGALAQNGIQELKDLLAQIEAASRKADGSAQRINAVIHTLTDILRGSSGEMAPLSLIVLCRQALEASRFSTYEENLPGCKIVEDIAPNILILGNLEQLLQVFVNLIKNAYEAMENRMGRQVVISGRVDPQDPQMARIEITDTGPGIPLEILPKIWLQGFSTKPKKDKGIGAAGQGQGLFVSKHIVESIHKGVITVESTVGQGTKFILKLPLAEVGANV
jgi:signal transduction histidine kinase